MGRAHPAVVEVETIKTMMRSGIIPINRRHPSPGVVADLAQYLTDGLPVVLPTETQYALSADATSAEAVDAVRRIKGRRHEQPFSIFLPEPDSLEDWGICCTGPSRALATAFWPGPLTLILPTDNPIFDRLGTDGRSVAVRVSPEPIVNELTKLLARPLVATSANPSGRSLRPAGENRWLSRQARNGQLIWARPSVFHRRPPSTIVDCRGANVKLVRVGPISWGECRLAMAGQWAPRLPVFRMATTL